ncbi:hypothetical protein GX586_01190 [bacterium]|nr:hypothetical protein [bacterium]
MRTKRLTRLAIAALLTVLVHGVGHAAIDVRIEASRTNGVAPLYVFFDATDTRGLAPTAFMPSGDFVNASFRWQFDTSDVDPNGKHETVFGFVAAHVFEKPGTYTLNVEVIDATGAVAYATLKVTATAFAGQTWYVAASGNDANAGTIASPWASAGHAFDEVASNTRILFRNGDTFNFDSATFEDIIGPVIISGYSDPAHPSTNTPVLQLQNNRGAIAIGPDSRDFRITDLHIKGMGGAVRGEGGGGPSFGDGAMHNLFLRLEVSDVGKDAFGTGKADANGIVDCYGHNYMAYGCFAGTGRRLALLGNVMRNQIGDSDEHVVRIAGGEKHYICYNDFSQTIVNSKSAIQIRGQPPNPSTNRHAVVSFNTVDRIIGFNPTNEDALQYILECLCEGNLIMRNRAYTEYDGDVAINTEGSRIVIRNNVLVDFLRPINIGAHPLAGPSHEISVYHNTVLAVNSRHCKIIQVIDGCTGIISRNNLLRGAATTYDQTDKILNASDDTEVQSGHNLFYAPGYAPSWTIVTYDGGSYTLAQAQAQHGLEVGTLTNNPQLAPTANPLDPAYATLMSNSPARDAGAVVPVRYDRAGMPRPFGSAPDIGAYEFVPEPMGMLALCAVLYCSSRCRACDNYPFNKQRNHRRVR